MKKQGGDAIENSRSLCLCAFVVEYRAISINKAKQNSTNGIMGTKDPQKRFFILTGVQRVMSVFHAHLHALFHHHE